MLISVGLSSKVASPKFRFGMVATKSADGDENSAMVFWAMTASTTGVGLPSMSGLVFEMTASSSPQQFLRNFNEVIWQLKTAHALSRFTIMRNKTSEG
jgi:hypothetical protein